MNGRGDLLLAFATATVFHAGAISVGFDQNGGGGAGNDGANRVTLEVASPSIDTLVRRWDRTPSVSEPDALQTPTAQSESAKLTVADARPARIPRPISLALADAPRASPAPDTSVPARPGAPSSMHEATRMASVDENPIYSPAPVLAIPIDNSAPPNLEKLPPPFETAPQLAERPAPRPAPTAIAAATRQVAGGKGKTGTRGAARSAPKMSEKAQQAAASAWAADIQRRIARHHAYPRGSRDEGRVRVAMVILPSGKLSRVSVVQSSGSSALDTAAIAAVKRAAPFPPAPSSLSDEWFNVGQWISFEQR